MRLFGMSGKEGGSASQIRPQAVSVWLGRLGAGVPGAVGIEVDGVSLEVAVSVGAVTVGPGAHPTTRPATTNAVSAAEARTRRW